MKCIVLQVEVQVESIDKGGNMIGWLFVDNVNLSLALVENGLSKVHFTAERTAYFKELEMAQEKAKAKKIGIWKDYVEEVKETVATEESERKTNYKKIIVTEITSGVTFWAQSLDNGKFKKINSWRSATYESKLLPPQQAKRARRRNIASRVEVCWKGFSDFRVVYLLSLDYSV